MSIIAVDFDGTPCTQKWPEIGEPNVALIEWLIAHQARGDRLILWTCRAGAMLNAAVLWCAERGLVFDTINANLPENIEKYGNDCRKVYADVYLDDKAGYIGRISPFPLYEPPAKGHEQDSCWRARD